MQTRRTASKRRDDSFSSSSRDTVHTLTSRATSQRADVATSAAARSRQHSTHTAQTHSDKHSTHTAQTHTHSTDTNITETIFPRIYACRYYAHPRARALCLSQFLSKGTRRHVPVQYSSYFFLALGQRGPRKGVCVKKRGGLVSWCLLS